MRLLFPLPSGPSAAWSSPTTSKDIKRELASINLLHQSSFTLSSKDFPDKPDFILHHIQNPQALPSNRIASSHEDLHAPEILSHRLDLGS